MAQLDPSIIMRAGQYPRRDPLETHANVLAIKGQERKNQLEEAKWQDAQRQRAAQEQQRAAFQQAYNPETGQFDERAVRNVLGAGGDVTGIDERNKMQREREKGDLDAEGKRLEVTAKRMENLGRILQSVTDQPSYDRAIQRMRSMGMDTADIPPQYDPQDVRENIQASMTAAQQMRLKLSERQTVASETRARASTKTADAASRGLMGSNTTIQMPPNVVAEKEGAAYGKYLVEKDYGRVDEIANNAQTVLDNLYILKNIDVKTGALEPMKAWASGLAEAFGVDPARLKLDSATNAQSFEGIAQTLVLDVMQAQKGPQTENDAKRIERTVASMRNTPEAREFLTDAAIALNERKIEQREFYQDHEEKNGTFRGAQRAWREFKKQTPLLGKNPTTGRPVFYNQFVRKVMESNTGASPEEVREFMAANPGASQEDVIEFKESKRATMDKVLKLWRDKYGG